MKLKRYQGNPVLEPRGDDWESIAVFNCAATYKEGKIHVLYRAVGDYVRYVSRLGYAIFDEELNLLERPEEPIFSPDVKLWEMSIEDPRFNKIDNELYLTYVVTPTPSPPGAVRRRLGIPKPETAGPRMALARVEDFHQFTRLGIITPYDADERNVVLFPEKIQRGGTRPFTGRATGSAPAIRWSDPASISPSSTTYQAGCTTTK